MIPLIVCCPGPALKTAPRDMRGPGRAIMAINTAYPRVVPDMWVGMDDPLCFDDNLFLEAFPKYMRSCMACRPDGRGIPPEVRFGVVPVRVAKSGVESIVSSPDPRSLVWMKHTLGTAMHIAYVLGFRRIGLAGCDLGGGSTYYDDRILPKEREDANLRLYKQQGEFLRRLDELARPLGVDLVSHTPRSPINDFLSYIPLEVALEEYSAPLTGRAPAHCKDIGRGVPFKPPAPPSIPATPSWRMSVRGDALSKRFSAVCHTPVMEEPLTVVCVFRTGDVVNSLNGVKLLGGEYKVEHVERLRDQVAVRNPEASFVCMSNVEVPFRRIPLLHDWPGWWSKIELFRPGLFSGPVLYLDLDTDVIGDLNHLRSAVFTMVGAPTEPCSGSMAWGGDAPVAVYNKFKADPKKAMASHTRVGGPSGWGDQGFISTTLGRDSLRFFPYARVPGRLDKMSPLAIIRRFHGKLRPWGKSPTG